MVWQQERSLVYEDFLEKYRYVIFFFSAFFVLLSARLFYLQIIRGRYYNNLSEQQRTHVILERAPRGIIYDRQGDVLVGNKIVFVGIFYPFNKGSIVPTNEILNQLKTILSIKDLSVSITNGWRTGQAVRIADNLSRSDMFRLQEQRLVLPGISVVREARRSCRIPEANSHLLGYLSEISPKELSNMSQEGYKNGDWIGRGGLEQIYNGILRGHDGGWQIEVDASGHQTRLVRHIQPIFGNNLYTTIDSRLQEAAMSALKDSSTGRGAVVGLDPRSGAVRVLVSSPGFDPNTSLTRDFSRYLTDDKLPLFNRAIQGLYPPGSIFKIITFIAALTDGNMDLRQSFACNGSFSLGNKQFRCWEKKGHGRLSLIPAFANSCNVFFYQVGLKVGPKLLETLAKQFYVGELTGIELPSEKRGLVPGPEWKMKKMNESWQQGDTVNMAIGQGPLWVTPIEMALMISAVANKGVLYQPYIVEKIVTPPGETIYQSQVRKKGEVKIPDNIRQALEFALEEVVKNGTGRACFFKNLKVSAKTGTAQNPHGKDHAWFLAFAPSEKPELAVAVLVENGGGGGAVAGPIARKIFETYFKLDEADLKIKTSNIVDESASHNVQTSTQ